jgi:hypothetical protein
MKVCMLGDAQHVEEVRYDVVAILFNSDFTGYILVVFSQFEHM